MVKIDIWDEDLKKKVWNRPNATTHTRGLWEPYGKYKERQLITFDDGSRVWNYRRIKDQPPQEREFDSPLPEGTEFAEWPTTIWIQGEEYLIQINVQEYAGNQVYTSKWYSEPDTIHGYNVKKLESLEGTYATDQNWRKRWEDYFLSKASKPVEPPRDPYPVSTFTEQEQQMVFDDLETLKHDYRELKRYISTLSDDIVSQLKVPDIDDEKPTWMGELQRLVNESKRIYDTDRIEEEREREEHMIGLMEQTQRSLGHIMESERYQQKQFEAIKDLPDHLVREYIDVTAQKMRDYVAKGMDDAEEAFFVNQMKILRMLDEDRKKEEERFTILYEKATEEESYDPDDPEYHMTSQDPWMRRSDIEDAPEIDVLEAQLERQEQDIQDIKTGMAIGYDLAEQIGLLQSSLFSIFGREDQGGLIDLEGWGANWAGRLATMEATSMIFEDMGTRTETQLEELLEIAKGIEVKTRDPIGRRSYYSPTSPKARIDYGTHSGSTAWYRQEFIKLQDQLMRQGKLKSKWKIAVPYRLPAYQYWEKMYNSLLVWSYDH